MKSFTVTEDHMKLLPKLGFDWNSDMYDGAPTVDIKRPYGNSDTLGYDVPIILGIRTDRYSDSWAELTMEEKERCRVAHRGMDTVLQILCCMGSIRPEEYECDRYNYNGWHVKRK